MIEPPVITAVFAGLLIALQQVLMLSVGMHRVSARIGVGTKNDDVLLRKQRRHANMAENSAILIIIVGLLELLRVSDQVVAAFAALYLLGRICHAIGFSSSAGAVADEVNMPSLLRTIGAAITAVGGFVGALFVAYSAMIA